MLCTNVYCTGICVLPITPACNQYRICMCNMQLCISNAYAFSQLVRILVLTTPQDLKKTPRTWALEARHWARNKKKEIRKLKYIPENRATINNF